MDLTPIVAQGRQLIQGYGRAASRSPAPGIAGSVLVLPDRTLPWAVARSPAVTPRKPRADHRPRPRSRS